MDPREREEAARKAAVEMVWVRTRDRLDTYLEGTVAALYARKWFPVEVRLGLHSGSDRIVAEGQGYEPDSEDSGYGLRLTLNLGRETECVVEVEGYPVQVHRDLVHDQATSRGMDGCS